MFVAIIGFRFSGFVGVPVTGIGVILSMSMAMPGLSPRDVLRFPAVRMTVTLFGLRLRVMRVAVPVGVRVLAMAVSLAIRMTVRGFLLSTRGQQG